MGERGVQGLTTAATGPLDLRGPSEAVILEAVLLGPSTAGSTCRLPRTKVTPAAGPIDKTANPTHDRFTNLLVYS